MRERERERESFLVETLCILLLLLLLSVLNVHIRASFVVFCSFFSAFRSLSRSVVVRDDVLFVIRVRRARLHVRRAGGFEH